jgi:hypothetical protein
VSELEISFDGEKARVVIHHAQVSEVSVSYGCSIATSASVSVDRAGLTEALSKLLTWEASHEAARV